MEPKTPYYQRTGRESLELLSATTAGLTAQEARQRLE